MSGAADLQQIVTCLTRMARTRPDMALRQARSLLEQARAFTIYLNRWTWILVVLAWGHHLVRGPSRALTYATAAIFPC